MTVTMSTWWHPTYIAAARNAYPHVCGDEELAVGWKLTHVDGTTHGGYYWRQVNGQFDLPVLHEATAWDHTNFGSCPSVEGDGLCLVTDNGINEASSGGVTLASSIGHVVVYAPTLASSDLPGKFRVPWCIDVDCFDPLALIRGGLVAYLAGVNLNGANLYRANLDGANLAGATLTEANLTRANLYGANLYRANLTGANLTRVNLTRANLTRANLTEANLTRANLYGANLTRANLTGANLTRVNLYRADLTKANLTAANGGGSAVWPDGFDWQAKGVLP
jgi:hypothetical protein